MLICGLWDIYAWFYLQPVDTISQMIWRLGQRAPVVTVSIGVLLGHLFWPVVINNAEPIQEVVHHDR